MLLPPNKANLPLRSKHLPFSISQSVKGILFPPKPFGMINPTLTLSLNIGSPTNFSDVLETEKKG